MNIRDYVKQNKSFLIYGILVVIFLIAIGLRQDSVMKKKTTVKLTPTQSISVTPQQNKPTPTLEATVSAKPTIASELLLQRKPTIPYVRVATPTAGLK